MALVGVLLAVCASTGPAAGSASAAEKPATLWDGWATSPKIETDPRAHALAGLTPTTSAAAVHLVANPATKGQTWLGVGASATDASVSLINAAGPALVRELLSPDPAGGANLNILRLPLSATDFSYFSIDPAARSTPDWSWPDAQVMPPELQRSIALVRQAKNLNPALTVVATAWSAPPAMKSNANINGGELKAGTESAYAALLVSQARALLAAGVPLRAMTLGNEPGHASNYPTMKMSDDQMAKLAIAVSPSLKKLGVELWALDHNWDSWARVNAQLSSAPGTFAGAAFHCYSDVKDVPRMADVNVPPIVTECSGTTDTFAGTFAWDTQNLVVRSVRAGSTGLLMWNLALDPFNRLHTNGCRNCRGLVTVDASGAWTRGPEFYVLGQVARAAQPGAVNIGVKDRARSDVNAVAFQNPDGTVGVFGHNDSAQERVFGVAIGSGAETSFVVGPGELFSFRSKQAPAPAPASRVKPFHVIRVAGSGASWYVDGALKKHWIQYGETYLCLMERRTPLIDGLTQAEADVLEDGPWTPDCLAPSRFEGKLLQAPDGFSYLVDGGRRHWIENGGTFLCLKTWGRRPVAGPWTWEQVNSITEDTRAHAACSPTDAKGKVIREKAFGTSWYVDGALKKHWIPDGDTWYCMTDRYPLVDGLTQEHADALADGDWVSPCLSPARFDHTIARAMDKPDPKPSYAVYGGQRHWIPDPWTYGYLAGHGFRVADVATEAAIKSLPDGGTEPAKLDPAAIPRNSVIRRADGVSWVVDGSGVRHHIPYVQDDVCWRDLRGYAVSATGLTAGQANALPEADAWPCIIGERIVKSSDGSSHWVDTTNTRHWIPDAETFSVLARSYPVVGPWPAADVDRLPRGNQMAYRIDPNAVVNSIICRDDRVCWAVDGGATRHWIPSYVDDICWRWVNGWHVSRSGLNAEQAASLAEAGAWGCSLNGWILAANEGAAYYIEGTTRRWIQDPESFECYVHRGARVIRGIGMAEVSGIAEGPAMPWCFDSRAYAGHIVNWNGDTNTQKTSWAVSQDLKRYWIPDGGTYNCLKGTGFGGPDSLSSNALSSLPDQQGQHITCGGDWLGTNRVLLRNTYIRSNDGRYVLWLQGDGNLVMYGPQGVVWANSRTSDILILQSDGNLVTYAYGQGATWSTGTAGSGANVLVVQNDGHLVLYAPGRAVWSR